MQLATSEHCGIATPLPWVIRTLLPVLLFLVLLPGMAAALDTDGDGLEDAFEVANGFDPADPDEDGNGRIDGQDDFDGDGLGNAAEAAVGTDPNDPDSDDDGLSDGEEIGTGSFGPQQVISTLVNNARSVFAADVDGDGDLDALSASAGRIAWYENTDGAGSFGPQRVIRTLASAASSVFAGDVDGDGDLDVLSAAGEVAWYENTDGAGSFGSQQVIGTPSGPTSVFAADMDGDGDLDALSSSANDNKIVWYENTDGAGSFGPQRGISVLASSARSVVAADVDGDGDLDALSASAGNDQIAWHENSDGAGNFVSPEVISTLADGASSVFAADMDGDGDLDALSASEGDDKIAWYENTDGAGSFGPQQVISTLANAASSVFAGDVDGDGDLDALSASRFDDKIAWYENTDGAGSFGVQQVISTQADNALSIFAADVDGDGDLDVLSASAGSALPGDDKIAWYEQLNVANPLDSDSDDDGLSDEFEVNTLGTDPLDPDTDDDGLLDGVETNTGTYVSPSDTGTDPLDPDTDGDRLIDGAETNTGTYVSPSDAGTDPFDPDTDDDGFEDGTEVHLGSDPLDDTSTPPLPLPECFDGIDNDGNSFVDFPEDPGCDSYQDPVEFGVDSDGDGTPDELDFCSANPTAPIPCGLDTDRDGYGNACDADFNIDGASGFSDVAFFVADLGAGVDTGSGTDMNCDGAVNFLDVAPFAAQLGQGTPGPSGLPCAGTVPCP